MSQKPKSLTPQKWEFISRTPVFNHARLSLVEDRVRLPNGKEIHYILEAPSPCGSVAVIALNSQGQILLQREYSYPTGEILYQLPGGAIEEGEDILNAAARELSEESGYTPQKMDMLGSYYLNNRRSDRRQFVVLCEDLSPVEAPSDPEEFIENIWVDFSEVRVMIRAGRIENITLLAALKLFENSRPYQESIPDISNSPL